MFDLETAIAEWRQQMRAAGIQSPQTLAELECHLRDAVEQHLKSGLNKPAAFHAAVGDLGNAGLLKREFAWAGGFWGWFGEDKITRITRVLGLVWLVQSLWYLGETMLAVNQHFFQDAGKPTVALLIAVLTFIAVQELGGIIGGVLLMRGAKGGRKLIRILAIMDVIPALCAFSSCFFLKNHPVLTVTDVANVVFDLVTLWWLRPGRMARVAAN